MRQLQDLLPCCAVIVALTAVVYFTPVLARYMSNEGSSHQIPAVHRHLALRTSIHGRDSQ
jgi:hypothetical protein